MSRITKFFLAITMFVVLGAGFAFFAPRAQAADGTFNVSVFHGINGKNLGLSRELPVTAYVYKGDVLLARIPLEFRERFSADLPAGTYTIKVFSNELGVFLPSMEVGPVALSEGLMVRLNAQLVNGAPDLIARVK